MDYSKPTLLVISGPNGAGKSTHIQTMLPAQLKDLRSFDRDKIRTEFATLLSKKGSNLIDIPVKSTRLMEERLVAEMKQAIASRSHFILETPLSHPDYWQYIDLFENNNYQIQLNYLCLDRIEDCISRVSQRVIEGGHYVEPSTIKGVYEKNLKHVNEYFKTFKLIELYDGMKTPTLLAAIEDENVVKADIKALKKRWIKIGLPALFHDIQLFLQSNINH